MRSLYISPHAHAYVGQSAQDLFKDWADGASLAKKLDAFPPAAFPPVWTASPFTPLTPALKDAAHAPEDTVDWILNDFDETNIDGVTIVPVCRQEPWETIGLCASIFKPKLVGSILPPFLQIELRFQGAVRALGFPVCTISDGRVEGMVALMEPLSVGGIVLPASSFERCATEIRDRGVPQPYYQVILGPKESIPLARTGQRIFYEIHLVPGIVEFFQCEHLAGSDLFHPSDRFLWEFTGETALVTDMRAVPLFTRLEIPRKVRAENKHCACGRTFRASFI